MNENTTISWIFLATALASEQDPASFESISQIADGINHAVPTDKELQKSLTWLTNSGTVEKTGKKYKLTSTGTEAIDKAKSRTTNAVLNIWDELTKEIIKTKVQQQV